MKLSHQATILFWGRLTSQLALVVRAMIFSRMMDIAVKLIPQYVFKI